MARNPVFLDRVRYRQRRLMDAVRLLPLLGLTLWMVPLMWAVPSDASDPVPISAALRYIFGIWVLMVLAALALWWRTRRTPAATDDEAA